MSLTSACLSLVPWGVILYIISLAVYRLVLSPLAGVPGPRLAALTHWYECYYDVILPGKYVFRIKEMHEQYGPIVRISPRELSFSDPAFVDVIYAPRPKERRDKDLYSLRALGTAEALGTTISHDLHKRRREPLSGFFSRATIFRRVAPLLKQKAEQLDDLFARAARSREVLNLSDILYGMANDVVREYSFGSNQDLLADLDRAGEMRNNIKALVHGTNFAKNFIWIQNILVSLPDRLAPPAVQDMLTFRRHIRSEIEQVTGSNGPKSNEADETSIFPILRASKTLPADEKKPQRLEDEATLLVLAGTDSPAMALTLAMYHLIANPSLMKKLRAELKQNPSSELNAIDKLPYLGAVLTEAYRLNFGLSGRHPQCDPDNAIQYHDSISGKTYTIPPGTPMGVQTLVLHTNEDLFPDPWTFNPDRWLGTDGAERRKHLLSFNKGTRQCLGMHLADAELRCALVKAAQWDMELFETNEDDVAFLHDYFVATPRLDSKGVRVQVSGRAL